MQGRYRTVQYNSIIGTAGGVRDRTGWASGIYNMGFGVKDWKKRTEWTTNMNVDVFNIYNPEEVQEDSGIHLRVEKEQWGIARGSTRRAGGYGPLARYLSGLRHVDAPHT